MIAMPASAFIFDRTYPIIERMLFHRRSTGQMHGPIFVPDDFYDDLVEEYDKKTMRLSEAFGADIPKPFDTENDELYFRGQPVYSYQKAYQAIKNVVKMGDLISAVNRFKP